MATIPFERTHRQQAPDAPARQNQDSGYRIAHRVVDFITTDRMEFQNITERVNEVVRRSGIRDGLVHLQSLHTTASVLVCEWQDALIHDMRAHFHRIAEREIYYKHNDPAYSDCERKNADSHMRGMLAGPAVTLQVRNGGLLLGTWQSVALAEFDGPRSRSLAIQVSGV